MSYCQCRISSKKEMNPIRCVGHTIILGLGLNLLSTIRLIVSGLSAIRPLCPVGNDLGAMPDVRISRADCPFLTTPSGQDLEPARAPRMQR